MDDMNPPETKSSPSKPGGEAARSRIPRNLALGVAAVLLLGALLIWHAESKVNQVALASSAQPVSVIEAKAARYRAQRSYVGRLDPWVSANVGPQFIAAYIDAVLVRPGAQVKQGQVLATLDCRNENAAARAVEMQARALDEEQRQLSRESTRVSAMLDGGFVSANEAEVKSTASAAKQAELLSARAKLAGSSLEVQDCILRAPFDGEVSARQMDPGGFVRPGNTIVSIIDRRTVRMTADVPESDFAFVSPGQAARVHVDATHRELAISISRRAPAADPGTRTVHIEADIRDPDDEIPVGTTGEVEVDVGAPIDAVELPVNAASIRDTKASVFVVEGDLAHQRSFTLLGESAGVIYASPGALAPGSLVVTEGRALLKEGAAVAPRLENPGEAAPARDAGFAETRATPASPERKQP